MSNSTDSGGLPDDIIYSGLCYHTAAPLPHPLKDFNRRHPAGLSFLWRGAVGANLSVALARILAKKIDEATISALTEARANGVLTSPPPQSAGIYAFYLDAPLNQVPVGEDCIVPISFNAGRRLTFVNDAEKLQVMLVPPDRIPPAFGLWVSVSLEQVTDKDLLFAKVSGLLPSNNPHTPPTILGTPKFWSDNVVLMPALDYGAPHHLASPPCKVELWRNFCETYGSITQPLDTQIRYAYDAIDPLRRKFKLDPALWNFTPVTSTPLAAGQVADTLHTFIPAPHQQQGGFYLQWHNPAAADKRIALCRLSNETSHLLGTDLPLSHFKIWPIHKRHDANAIASNIARGVMPPPLAPQSPASTVIYKNRKALVDWGFMNRLLRHAR